MSPATLVAVHLREAGLGGNSTDPSFFDERAEMLETLARAEPNLASTALTFAANSRDRANAIRSRRRGRR